MILFLVKTMDYVPLRMAAHLCVNALLNTKVKHAKVRLHAAMILTLVARSFHTHL